MLTTIEGQLAPYAEIHLDRGEILFTEPQTVMAVSGAKVTTSIAGGLSAGIMRVMGGASPFLIEVHGPGTVSLSRGATGKIVALDCAKGSLLLQRQAFLFAPGAVHLTVQGPTSLGSLLDRVGHLSPFVLEAKGEGQVWVFAWGDTQEMILGAGESIDVAPGRIVAIDQTVSLKARPAGWKNTLLGGMGLTLATLTGPGRVLLQTRDVDAARPRPKSSSPPRRKDDRHRHPRSPDRRPSRGDDVQEQWLFDDHRDD